MSAITIRKLSEETRRALRVRAAEHGRSVEAEIRVILDDAVKPADRIKLGTALVKLFKPLGGIDLEIERDRALAEAAVFE